MKDNGEIVEFIKKKDYEMVNNNLGSGSFGKTVLLKDPFIDELFVAKKYEPYYPEDKKEFFDSFLREIKIMHKLNHRNVIRIYNYYAYSEVYTGYILMEYIDGQTIAEYFDEYSPFKLDTVTPNDVFTQLIDGFQYIESQGIVHRDIREGNILVDKSGTVKIIDFGLGKTFKPVDSVGDSMRDIINRSGLDALPNEYFEGVYDSQTDMFYLAELVGRLLRNSSNDPLFSYHHILHKMMEPQKSNRFSSFAEIKDAIQQKDFTSWKIEETDKRIYQSFSNAIYYILVTFNEKPIFVYDIDEFANRLDTIITKNCFEDEIQDNSDIVSLILKNGFTFRDNRSFNCSVLTEFRTWFSSLSVDSKRLVLNNIIAKISTKPIKEPEEDLPF